MSTDERIVMIKENELKELKEAAKLLARLQACGVDNWEGYDEAMGEDN